MEAFSSAVAVLTAMITPAVLISACGTLILSTSSRLGRIVDRVRNLSDEFEQLAHKQMATDLIEVKRATIFDQLDKLTSRSRMLQRSMTVFYLAVGFFVATTVAIGVVGVVNVRYSFVPIGLGLIGAFFLFYGSILLIFEARLAQLTLYAEMDFIWKLAKHYAPAELVEQHTPPRPPYKDHE